MSVGENEVNLLQDLGANYENAFCTFPYDTFADAVHVFKELVLKGCRTIEPADKIVNYMIHVKQPLGQTVIVVLHKP